MNAVKVVVLVLSLAASNAACAQDDAQATGVDNIFARLRADTPGCVVGVAQGGKPALIRAYGMADLEHGVPNTAETVFEAGSVSKQFTAAAVALLAQDGKLALDDEVRKYIPELPDYGHRLTIRHMLNHTSGLRDWGGVAEIAGWPRTTRAYDQAQALAIAVRQRKLNFAPGTEFSYSNTGYTLAAIIVERVSGQRFADFTAERIFAPLGMQNTSWRDDYTRVVKRRAIAYEKKSGSYYTLMPFESTYGHAALLTTVGDLLKWSANFDQPQVGGPKLIADLQTAGKFGDGAAHNYGLGIFVDQYRGQTWMQHGGATAGYRTFLSRLPSQQLAVALLCNGADAIERQTVSRLNDLFMTGVAPMPAPAAAPAFPIDLKQMAARDGMYRDTFGRTLTVRALGEGLELDGTPFRATDGRSMRSAAGSAIVFGPGGAMNATDKFGRLTVYKQIDPVDPLPDVAGVRELSGTYYSADADARWMIYSENGKLLARQWAGKAVELTPSYRDAFTAQGGLVIFRRDARGRINGLSVVQERVRDMPFVKMAAGSDPAR